MRKMTENEKQIKEHSGILYDFGEGITFYR